MVRLSRKYSYITLATGVFLVIAGFLGGNETAGFIGLGVAIFAVILAALSNRPQPQEPTIPNELLTPTAPQPTYQPAYQRSSQSIAETIIPMLDECLAKASVTAKLTATVPVTQEFNYKGQAGKIEGQLVIDIDNTVSKNIAVPPPQETPKPAEPIITERSVRD